MTNRMNNRTVLLGFAALVAALAFSTQSANAQGFNQPNRGGLYEQRREPNRAAVQQHQPQYGPAINRNVMPSQQFGLKSPAAKKVETINVTRNHGSNHREPAPVAVPCHHQPTPQVVVVAQPKKPCLLERIVNVFR